MQQLRAEFIVPGSSLVPVTAYFADINGDGKVDAEDRIHIGNPQPKFFGGLNLDGTYKAWDINLYFYGSYGNKILNYVESNLESFAKRGSEGADNVSSGIFHECTGRQLNPSDRYARALPNGGDNSIA